MNRSQQMLQWCKDLFPMPRSLTGLGVKRTLDYLRKLNPELQVTTIASDSTVFDWAVPKEWAIREAFIQHIDSGQKFAEFSKLNLHVVGYSVPVDTVMLLGEIKSEIHTEPKQPDWVPYVTSYYDRTWGFCMSENQKASLPEGDYRVLIDSDLFDGEMLLADAVLPGNKEEEIFFSTYICHPSMANNELSGPALSAALMHFVKQEIDSPRFTYRFALVPETIGSLAYLQANLNLLKRNVVCGFVLSCVGDDRAYSHVESRMGGSLADRALEAAFVGLPNVTRYSFLQRGSDERQYCAPGIDLPVAGFCRSKLGEYPEYHTSADNFDVVTAEGLRGSYEVMTQIIRAFEVGLFPKVCVLGEPQLGKRNMYPTVSRKGSLPQSTKHRMDLLAYSDGQHSIFDIGLKIYAPISEVISEIRLLKDCGLLETRDSRWPTNEHE